MFCRNLISVMKKSMADELAYTTQTEGLKNKLSNLPYQPHTV